MDSPRTRETGFESDWIEGRFFGGHRLFSKYRVSLCQRNEKADEYLRKYKKEFIFELWNYVSKYFEVLNG